MEPKRLVELYDRCFDGVAVTRRFWHICFGTLEGFGYGGANIPAAISDDLERLGGPARVRVRQPGDGRE